MTHTYTIAQVAKALRLSKTAVGRFVRSGRLRATGRPKRVAVDDLLAFLKLTRKVGRPAKPKKPKRPRGRPRKNVIIDLGSF